MYDNQKFFSGYLFGRPTEDSTLMIEAAYYNLFERR
jgi:hypothetical protein